MKAAEITMLKAAGWKPAVLTTLKSLGFQLDHHDPVNEVIEVSIPRDDEAIMPVHGFTVHRTDSARCITIFIFGAGVFNHQKQTRDAFHGLLTAAGMQLH